MINRHAATRRKPSVRKFTLAGIASPYHSPVSVMGLEADMQKVWAARRPGQRPLLQQSLLRFQRRVSAKIVPTLGRRIRILSTERKSASGRTAPTRNF